MKALLASVTLMLAAVLSVPASAQRCPNAGRCPPGTCSQSNTIQACDIRNCSAANCQVLRKDARGNQVKVTITGKYSDCIKDGLRMGYSADAVKRYCDSRPGPWRDR
jgi:hypothetical protein